ncbi:hypothetical protein VTI74DRAFT_5872 [Chaetomium olivicolor]
MLAEEPNNPGLVSAAFFCPQARAPDENYLFGMHSFLRQDKYGQLLLKEIIALKTDQVWSIFAHAAPDVAALSYGPEYVDMLHDWAADAVCSPLAAVRSGIVALPLLLILQITQYLGYLAHHGLSHQEFLASVDKGGSIQGYCGGLPSAMAIACAKDEAEVIKYTATAMRVVLGVGAYGEAADDSGGPGLTTLPMRLKYEGQGDDLTRRLHKLYCFARDHKGLQVHKMEVRGKVHNPDNEQLAAQLCRVCSKTASLQLPDASQLRVQVRSNRSGQRLSRGSLTEEVVATILASRCEWYSLFGEVAKDLGRGGCSAPAFVYFGLTDCVPLTPFHKRGIRPAKTSAHGLIRTQRTGKTPSFPDNALAVVGASCRLPGARNLEELWNVLASGTDCHQELPTDRFDIHGSFRATQSGKFAKGRKFYGNLIDDIQRFDNAFFGVSVREAVNMDPQQPAHSRDDGDNVGCFIGASFIGASFVEYLDNTSAHAPTAYTSTGTIRAFLCGRLSYYFGWSGPAEVIDTACSSSLVAINRACKAVQNGECRMALTGGINLITGINNYLDLAKAGFLSTTGQCKPFDAAADGYCRSDGAGLVVIKKLQLAMADGDSILGVIPGVATNRGGLSASITVPHSAAQQALYRSVLEQACLPPRASRTSRPTVPGPKLAIRWRWKAFDPSFRGSHQKAAAAASAGVAGLLKILAMLKHGQLPPQANHHRLNPKIAPLEPDGLAIARTLRAWDVPFRAALPAQKDAKPVVFLFSGQYDNKIGLDQSFYERVPAFRYHIDAVDSALQGLGYPSIIPAIFETQELSSIVTLQCSIFAMQYACAQCWMDAGLRPSAVVGHTLGELTALAVCGVLSLTDALKLVAARASLIEDKVKPERGAILALSLCSVQNFEHLSALLRQRQPPCELEIACYNAQTALVVAGTTAAVGAAESLLRTEPPCNKSWREAEIPLETSSKQPLGNMAVYSPSSHARDPVFFEKAICRVEERGSRGSTKRRHAEAKVGAQVARFVGTNGEGCRFAGHNGPGGEAKYNRGHGQRRCTHCPVHTQSDHASEDAAILNR